MRSIPNYEDPRIVYLIITTWAGTCGTHYYARLHRCTGGPGKWGRREHEQTDVEYTLDERTAGLLNFNVEEDIFRHEVGDTSSRFCTEEEAVEAAVLAFDAMDGPIVLLKSDWSCLDPCPVLRGPEPWAERMNAISERFEENDGWEGDEEKAETITAEWDSLFREQFPPADRNRRKAQKKRRSGG